MSSVYDYNKNFALHADNTAPAYSLLAVTPSDSVNFTKGPCRGLYVGVTGDVNIYMIDTTSVTFSAVPAGTILPVAALRVNSTSTTATSIVALF